jgi:hypothetical protein
MKIAIIGWGSLIWDPRQLFIASKWHRDGPSLPVEFARQSRNGRITLVIQEGSSKHQTYWALSGFSEIEDARRDLCDREGAGPIEAVVSGAAAEADEDSVVRAIRLWLNDGEHDLETAVWTGLPCKWNDQEGVSPTVEQAVDYLRGLHGGRREAAREYICKAPEQIQTRFRETIRNQLGWDDVTLPDTLFE